MMPTNAITPSLCSICQQDAGGIYFSKKKSGINYYYCKACDFVFMAKEHYLSSTQEHQHYLGHDNNVQDLRYQEFVQPLVDLILSNRTKGDLGLDFGCGPGPVITHMLQKQDYQVKLYDLFFHDDKEVLNQKYDYIILSEVAEHFQQPIQSFRLLQSLLKDGGEIYIMTGLIDHIKDFPSWHYHRDPTHVSFYSSHTFQVLASILKLELTYSDYKKCLILRA